MDQGIYHSENPDTCKCKYTSSQRLMIKTCGSFLHYTFGLWRDICGIKYGVPETEKRVILEEKVLTQVTMSYAQ